jgi:hypothetical protein
MAKEINAIVFLDAGGTGNTAGRIPAVKILSMAMFTWGLTQNFQ